MLILTRRAGEKLFIGDNITVTVLSIKGNQVRIGIEAPREVSVNREEIYQRILKEKQSLNGKSRVKTPVSITRRPEKTLTSTLSLPDKR